MRLRRLDERTRGLYGDVFGELREPQLEIDGERRSRNELNASCGLREAGQLGRDLVRAAFQSRHAVQTLAVGDGRPRRTRLGVPDVDRDARENRITLIDDAAVERAGGLCEQHTRRSREEHHDQNQESSDHRSTPPIVDEQEYVSARKTGPDYTSPTQ